MQKKSSVQSSIRKWTKQRTVDKCFDILFYIIITVISLTCLLPFIHVFSKSISEEAYVVANKVLLLPQGFSLEAYKKILSDGSIVRSLYVTVVMTLSFTVIGMLLTICSAYALSRKQLKGRKVFTFLFMLTMYFTAGIIPDYLLMSNLNLLDTWWCLILPLTFSAYNFLIMKNSFQNNISDSLIESAFIDGANHFTILGKIVIPLSKPILATIALFLAVGRWNAYQDALFYIKQKQELRPLQLKLYYLIISASESLQSEGGAIGASTNPEVIKAASVIFATVPIIIVYPFLQKYFVQGTMIGAVKE